MFYATLVVLVGITAVFAWNLTARTAYESAEYEVVESDGPFEIRDYPDLMLVSTEMQSASSQGGDGSFMRLFRYISGANETEQKVAMTTPVFMEETDEDATPRMGFVIPKGVASQGAPSPAAADVQLRERQGGRFAVIRFAGRMNTKSIENAQRRLRDWIASKGWKGDQRAESAGYDPPWTPGPLRRNEVLIRVVEE